MSDSSAELAGPNALLARWTMIVGSAETTRTHGVALLRRWAEPHRHYHDLSHLAAVLDRVDELVRAEPETAADPDAVRLAAFFHDAVYDPAGRDNEARSAELAGEVLRMLGLPEPRVGETERLVLLTATHEVVPGDGDGAVLCDADLAVLASDPESYAAYAVAVRAEYAHVPEPLFQAARAEILRELLGHDVLFRTATGRSWWEAAARRNVVAEIVLLTASMGRAGGDGAGQRPEGA